jgi:hypothetical protein
MEIWKDIPNYEGIYQASTLGDIKSLNYKKTKKEQILKQSLDGRGYLSVRLCKQGKSKSFTVHKLIAITFLSHVPDGTHKMCVDHKDNDRKNNILGNLQLLTNRENCSKNAKRNNKYTGVSWSKKAKRFRASIRINGKETHLGHFKCEILAAQAYQNKLKTL